MLSYLFDTRGQNSTEWKSLEINILLFLQPGIFPRFANGRTEVTLELESRGRYSWYFPGMLKHSLKLPEIGERPLLTLEGPWNLEFAKTGGI